MGFKRYSIPMIAVMLVVAMSLSSCDTLRRKFVRQKKKGQVVDNGMIPVLEPQEYPAPEHDPAENYRHHYALIKVWYRDLWTLLEEKDADKRMRYTLNQVFDQLEEMQKLVLPPAQTELGKLKGLLKYYDLSLNSPQPLRNISRLQSDLRAFDRQLRRHFSPSKLKDGLIKTGK